MKITVVSKVGFGRTELSAYDHALVQMHCTGYNLVRLSSVIPPRVEVLVKDAFQAPPKTIGHRLYTVEAYMRSSKKGDVVAAGVGWYQFLDSAKGGVFVEHELIGKSEAKAKKDLEHLIMLSLEDLCTFRNIKFQKEKVKMSIALGVVKNKPACALTLAIYQPEGWKKR